MTETDRRDWVADHRSPAGLDRAARAAMGRARDRVLGLQHEQGWWRAELETNVTMDAEDLLLREFLGLRTAEQTAAAARWIRSCRREDGTWANFRGGPLLHWSMYAIPGGVSRLDPGLKAPPPGVLGEVGIAMPASSCAFSV